MRPFFFPRPDRVERTVQRGPHPVAAFENAAIDAMAGRALRGHNGAIVIGRAGGRARIYMGELGAQQNFRGGVPLAAHAADRKGFNTALPNTHGPVVDPNPVMGLLARIPPPAANTLPS